jgi:hopene-associated glycosyltransferase HpnB
MAVARHSVREAQRLPDKTCLAGRHQRQRLTFPSEAAVITLTALAAFAALAWLYLLTLHGGFWRTGHRLPPASVEPGRPPSVTTIIPARNEAAILPASLPTLLGQDYPGQLAVIVVDDDSTDGTATVAQKLGADAGWTVRAKSEGTEPERAANRVLTIVAARDRPDGWAGKVWAMSEGVRAAAADTEYFLFTDADIAYRPGTLTSLADATAGGGFALLSQMALLRAATRWEKVLVPAFVYFFAQLYPFRRVSQPRSKTGAAAGGCMVVRADALAAAGGVAQIRAARIDDVALGQLIKRSGGRCWLGLTTDVLSLRPYDRLADIWDMVARSAYTQLSYSIAAVAGTVLTLCWLYLLPPAAAIAGVAMLAAGAGGAAAWLAAAGLVGWLAMSVTYVPMLRLYRLSAGRSPILPLVAAMYAAMTADSAWRHYRGRGGAWKGRVIEANQLFR